MLPPAPGRLSATTATPRSFAISSAMSRVRKSPDPPGGNPTTRRIGLAGNACAKTEVQNSQTSRTRNMQSPPASSLALSRARAHYPRGCGRRDAGAAAGARKGRGSDTYDRRVADAHHRRSAGAGGGRSAGACGGRRAGAGGGRNAGANHAAVARVARLALQHALDQHGGAVGREQRSAEERDAQLLRGWIDHSLLREQRTRELQALVYLEVAKSGPGGREGSSRAGAGGERHAGAGGERVAYGLQLRRGKAG